MIAAENRFVHCNISSSSRNDSGFNRTGGNTFLRAGKSDISCSELAADKDFAIRSQIVVAEHQSRCGNSCCKYNILNESGTGFNPDQSFAALSKRADRTAVQGNIGRNSFGDIECKRTFDSPVRQFKTDNILDNGIEFRIQSNAGEDTVLEKSDVVCINNGVGIGQFHILDRRGSVFVDDLNRLGCENFLRPPDLSRGIQVVEGTNYLERCSVNSKGVFDRNVSEIHSGSSRDHFAHVSQRRVFKCNTGRTCNIDTAATVNDSIDIRTVFANLDYGIRIGHFNHNCGIIGVSCHDIADIISGNSRLDQTAIHLDSVTSAIGHGIASNIKIACRELDINAVSKFRNIIITHYGIRKCAVKIDTTPIGAVTGQNIARKGRVGNGICGLESNAVSIRSIDFAICN